MVLKCSLKKIIDMQLEEIDISTNINWKNTSIGKDGKFEIDNN